MSGKTKVLVSGGTGYIGSDLVHKLISNNIEVAIVIRSLEEATRIFGTKVMYIEYLDLNLFNQEISKFSPEIVVHLAAYSTSSDEPKDIRKLIESNIIFTSNLLIALSSCNVKLFINTGSFSEYHNNNTSMSPTYFYSATKTSARYMIEYYSKKNDFKFINAILFTVYGKKNKHKKIIDYVIDSLQSDVAISMSDGKQILDFVHISDVVNFYYNLIINFRKIKPSKIDYEIGSGECLSIRELVKLLELITRKKSNISWGTNKNRKIDTVIACSDIEMSKKELGYNINISLESGLKEYVYVLSKNLNG